MSQVKQQTSSGKSGLGLGQRSNLGQVIAAQTEVPDISQEQLNKWVSSLYAFKISDEELKQINEAFSYKGFNRDDVLKQLTKYELRIAIELVILCAMRGPQAASRVMLTNGKTPAQMGIPASGGQGTKALTCNKITAATADLAASYLKRMNMSKRVNSDLPAWLQFPAAGSIKLPDNLRKLHMEFSRKFSELIGGVFQEQIYMQIEANSYLDNSLRLFDA
jgi:hypothetical protein